MIAHVMTRSRFLLSLLAALAVLLALPAVSSAASGTAESFVKAKQDKLRALLQQQSASASVDEVFDSMLDYDTLARDSLGKDWDKLSEAQRAEFQDLLEQLVRNAYRRDLQKTLGYEVEFKGQSDAKGGTLVKTVAKSKKDKRADPITIDYVVHQKDGKLMVRDISTAGSSMVRNYRSQFRRIIKKKGFPELIERMRDKLAQPD